MVCRALPTSHAGTVHCLTCWPAGRSPSGAQIRVRVNVWGRVVVVAVLCFAGAPVRRWSWRKLGAGEGAAAARQLPAPLTRELPCAHAEPPDAKQHAQDYV